MTLARFRQSQFLKHNAIFFAGSVGVGLLNYLYYPILGRLLQPSAFGEVQALVSLFFQLTIFLTVLSLVTVNLVANYQDKRRLGELLFELEKAALLVGLVLLAASMLFGSQLQEFLRFESAAPFTATGLAFVISIPLVFRSAYVRGRQKFAKASVVNLLAAGSKIIFSALLVTVGLGTLGAVLGIVAAQFLAFLAAAWWAYRLGLVRPDRRYFQLPKLGVIKTELKYAGLVFVSSVVITILYSIDIIVIKHYFDAHTAGLYAGIATVARIIFFLTASVVQVMLPGIKLDEQPRQNLALLVKSLALVALISLPVLAVFVTFPQYITNLLMGPSYTELAGLLPMLAVVIFTVSIINLLMNYYVGLRHYSIAIIGIIVAVAVSTLMVFRHENLTQIVQNLLYVSLATIALIIVWAQVRSNRKLTKET